MDYKCVKAFLSLSGRNYYYGNQISSTDYYNLLPSERANFIRNHEDDSRFSSGSSYNSSSDSSWLYSSNDSSTSSSWDFGGNSDSGSSSDSSSFDFGGGDTGGGGTSGDW